MSRLRVFRRCLLALSGFSALAYVFKNVCGDCLRRLSASCRDGASFKGFPALNFRSVQWGGLRKPPQRPWGARGAKGGFRSHSPSDG